MGSSFDWGRFLASHGGRASGHFRSGAGGAFLPGVGFLDTICSMAVMRLSVLDQSPIRSGGTAADAVHETLQLAELADRLGYHRYWLAEHHSSAALASSSPEILIGQVAIRTTHLRVGSGGVMLSHYSPLKVAENFRMLETLFPGRIDLGIGRAPGSDQRTARALRQGLGHLGIEHFPEQIADLIAFLEDRLASDHPFAGVRAMPTGPTTPALWLLGSSDASALYAAQFGAAFAFAHFISTEGGPEAMRAYREAFRPSGALARPCANVAVFALCADTEAEARRQAGVAICFCSGSSRVASGPTRPSKRPRAMPTRIVTWRSSSTPASARSPGRPSKSAIASSPSPPSTASRSWSSSAWPTISRCACARTSSSPTFSPSPAGRGDGPARTEMSGVQRSVTAPPRHSERPGVWGHFGPPYLSVRCLSWLRPWRGGGSDGPIPGGDGPRGRAGTRRLPPRLAEGDVAQPLP